MRPLLSLTSNYTSETAVLSVIPVSVQLTKNVSVVKVYLPVLAMVPVQAVQMGFIMMETYVCRVQ